MRCALLLAAVLVALGQDCPPVNSPCNGKNTLVYTVVEENCKCVCRTHWEGEFCGGCPHPFDENQDCEGCISEEYTGPDCALCTCAPGEERGPDKKSCDCVCKNKWERNPSTGKCDTCPEEYDASEDCNACAKGATGTFPNCKACNSYNQCHDHAESTTVVGDKCNCYCRNYWDGEWCADCPIEYDEGHDCDRCANGYIEEGPTCVKCDLQSKCNGHASAVESNSARTKCICDCMKGFEGEACEKCSVGYIEYPICKQCTNIEHCSGNAKSVTSLSNTCVCNCKDGYEGDKCDICKDGYISEGSKCTECTSKVHCNNHGEQVITNAAKTACICKTCINEYEGTFCETCNAPFGGSLCDTCDEEHVDYLTGCKRQCDKVADCSGKADSVKANSGRTDCVCTCSKGYEGESCETCETGYVKDAMGECNECTTSICVAGHAVGMLSSPDRKTCICNCGDPYEGDFCGDCATNYIEEGADCVKCTSKTHCNGHAKSTTNNAGHTGCICNCANAWEGDTCDTCPPEFDGANCNMCKIGYVGYPKCVKCTVNDHCGGTARATDVTSNRKTCQCSCRDPFEGAECERCADGYYGPNCDKCDQTATCGDRAVGIHSSSDRSRCICDCKDDYEGETCEKCSAGRISYPACERCTSATHCNNHAESVDDDGQRTSCVCDCRNYWEESDQCKTCNPPYGGPDCDACADPAGVLPTCNKCNSAEHCSGHASSVVADGGGCKCSCRNHWEGEKCDVCPAKYDPAKDCGKCKNGVGPDCRKCTVADDCSGNANSVIANTDTDTCVCRGQWDGYCGAWHANGTCTCNRDTGCPCGYKGCTFWGSCNYMWSGTNCSYCHDPHTLLNGHCRGCADGYVDYPRCYSCWNQPVEKWGCNRERTDSVYADPNDPYRTRCRCQCMAKYESEPDCDRCAYGYINYPECSRCDIHLHCNGNADSCGSDFNRTNCTCNCKEGFANSDYGMCDQCAEGYIGYPYCEKCTSSKHCSNHAVAVTSNADRTQCVCDCYGMWDGSQCESCSPIYEQTTCDKCGANRIYYPQCEECSIANHCSGHATAVEPDSVQKACKCTCSNFYGGARGTCSVCPEPYGGAACDACENMGAMLPKCGAQCTVAADCNNHAIRVIQENGKCVCACQNNWVGDACETCPVGYDGANCDTCADGYFLGGNGTCVQGCNNQEYCNGHACSFPSCVKADGKSCTCTCEGRWTGARCDVCPPPFKGEHCDTCLDGFHGPNCEPCNIDCEGREDQILTINGVCTCKCKINFEGDHCENCSPKFKGDYCENCVEHLAGERCDTCVAGFAGYPMCEECEVETHCNSEADEVYSDNNVCVCKCYSSWCGNYGICRSPLFPADTNDNSTVPDEGLPSCDDVRSRTETLTLTLTIPLDGGVQPSTKEEEEGGSESTWLIIAIVASVVVIAGAATYVAMTRKSDKKHPFDDKLLDEGDDELGDVANSSLYRAEDEVSMGTAPVSEEPQEPEAEMGDDNEVEMGDDEEAEMGDDEEIQQLDDDEDFDDDEDRRDV
eukprot:TRINITY_DN323_c0_g2_i1.p1 TRINITY_DN323_c0_g2~~TRINITY_DN323_c0_g2_i1.p1  ORF type:complete len:1523 (+),score=335.13 TRINITY_DN323_c0_g2_i1:2804-7372(+)